MSHRRNLRLYIYIIKVYYKKGGYDYDSRWSYMPEWISRFNSAISPGMFVRKDNYDVQASIIPEGYQFVPKYEIYNLGNGLSYVKPVA